MTMTMMMTLLRVRRALIAIGTNPLDMVVVAFLGQANFVLKAEYLLAILAAHAVHGIIAFQDFGQATHEGIDHERMVAQIACLDKLDARRLLCDAIAVLVYPLDQHASEQEVRKDQYALKAQVADSLQAGRHQGEGDAGIGGLPPAKAQPLPQKPGDLSNICVGVWIRGTAPDNHQQGLVATDLALLGIGFCTGGFDPCRCRAYHSGIHA